MLAGDGAGLARSDAGVVRSAEVARFFFDEVVTVEHHRFVVRLGANAERALERWVREALARDLCSASAQFGGERLPRSALHGTLLARGERVARRAREQGSKAVVERVES